jgi:DNA repair protein RecO (recombination protein O)
MAIGLCSSEAIIIKTYPLANSDKIAVAYTRGYGKLRGVASGARRLKSPFSGRLEPFNWVEMLFFDDERKELSRIDKVELLVAFGANVEDYRCFLQLNYLAELLLETTPDREPNDPLFRLVLLVLEAMQDPRKSDLAQAYFQVWHLRLAGMFPPTRVCPSCQTPLLPLERVYLGMASPGFYCSSCKGKSLGSLSGKAFMLLTEILRKPLKEIDFDSSGSFACSELSRVVEEMVQISFERRFESLALIQEGPSQN